MTARHNKTKGFTLVEILIVVVILGVLAGIVIPQFASASNDARKSTFITNLKAFAHAEGVYRLYEGGYLEDSSSGVCPAGFDAYAEKAKWEADTPIGGVWDAELNSFGITSGIGVHFQVGHGPNPGDALMLQIDAMMDDGDLATGSFRKLADDRYYYVIAP